MLRHYSFTMQLRKGPSRDRAVRSRDGLVTECNKTKHYEVDDSLDAEFGKIPHFKYYPHLPEPKWHK